MIENIFKWIFYDVKTYFISGHRDITEEEFYKHYRQRIIDAFVAGSKFVIGDCPGVDTLAQKLLKALSINPAKVLVFHIGNDPMYIEPGFNNISNYVNDFDRDINMTLYSNEDILWIRDGKINSGTHRNAQRRKWLNNIDKNSSISAEMFKMKELEETLENIDLI